MTMDTGEIHLGVYNGRRTPIPDNTELLVTARNGENKNVVHTFVRGGAVRLIGLPVKDNFADRYTVVVSAKDHVDAGFMPVTIRAGAPHALELLMLRRDAGYTFDTFAELQARPELVRFLEGDDPGGAQALYATLRENPPALACLLNIVAALEQMLLAPSELVDVNPMRSLMALQAAEPDRAFVWVRPGFLEQVTATAKAKKQGLARLEEAPAFLHKGATVSYKQIDFGEGNVQLSFHTERRRPVRGVECMLVDIDIDYFQDAGAHLLMEVFPNKLKSLIGGGKSAQLVTDPRLVYALRWIAGRRKGREFAPAYVLHV